MRATVLVIVLAACQKAQPPARQAVAVPEPIDAAPPPEPDAGEDDRDRTEGPSCVDQNVIDGRFLGPRVDTLTFQLCTTTFRHPGYTMVSKDFTLVVGNRSFLLGSTGPTPYGDGGFTLIGKIAIDKDRDVVVLHSVGGYGATSSTLSIVRLDAGDTPRTVWEETAHGIGGVARGDTLLVERWDVVRDADDKELAADERVVPNTSDDSMTWIVVRTSRVRLVGRGGAIEEYR